MSRHEGVKVCHHLISAYAGFDESDFEVSPRSGSASSWLGVVAFVLVRERRQRWRWNARLVACDVYHGVIPHERRVRYQHALRGVNDEFIALHRQANHLPKRIVVERHQQSWRTCDFFLHLPQCGWIGSVTQRGDTCPVVGRYHWNSGVRYLVACRQVVYYILLPISVDGSSRHGYVS